MTVFDRLLQTRNRKGGGFFLLLDPDRLSPRAIEELVGAASDAEVDAILVGTSLALFKNFQHSVRLIKGLAQCPVIIFPGSHSQIAPDADAVLFTSLISGRNPNYLIEEQVKGAPIIKEYGLETIPTGYMLIDSGRYTSVQFISHTLPIPSDKNDIACAHALAAEFLGMKMVFLEAGSGAERPVPDEMIKEVSEYISIPIMVGGGIRTPREVERKIKAGASFVVVGNHFEEGAGRELMREFVDAAHPRQQVGV
ncbi:Geranylgeranylglyceryl phosphate synthase [Candidatus Zixiibacteriota bacterium]|nr:Geranylgeranylglyceryl phosphate synthase [candidate division Zixibacteria bacterium]